MIKDKINNLSSEKRFKELSFNVGSSEWSEYHRKLKRLKEKKEQIKYKKKIYNYVLYIENQRYNPKINKKLSCVICKNPFLVRKRNKQRVRCKKCNFYHYQDKDKDKKDNFLELHKKNKPMINFKKEIRFI